MTSLVDRDPGDEHNVDDCCAAFEWRMRQLRRMGFEIPRAVELAENRVDIHEIRDLIRRGCPADLAAQIIE